MTFDLDATAMEVADAMGPGFTDLAPPGEAHFDPVSVSLLVAFWVLGAVAAGVHDGIQEAAKDGTAAVLHAIGRKIRERIIPHKVGALFSHDAVAGRDETRETAAIDLEQARQSAKVLSQDVIAQVAAAASAAAAESLKASGLDTIAAGKVAQTIEIRLSVALQESPKPA